ncbi:manganese efflux pump [Natroniella sulfidigena]|uniref:manganese efflux pump MntP n=1 Tax=Natroniella sulfidigena TaxID=723921 RepID=UPI00200AE8EF|nr:manganese efflux pump [Natroniella sulfidigena]MCK8815780.1 manganese efflux pump [Natroniella sulfidigena]
MVAAILLAISSTLDDLSIGFSMGLKKGRLAVRSIFGIATISGLTMAIGLLIGEQLARFFPERIDIYISVTVFVLFGLWFLWEGYTGDDQEEAQEKVEENLTERQYMSWYAIVTLGLALGVNSLFLGFSGGLQDYPVLFTSIATGAASMFFIWSGSRLGGRLTGWIGNRADYIAGTILLFMAVMEVV